MSSLPATVGILGGSAIFTTALTVAAYVCYDKKFYLSEKINELKDLENGINNSNSNTISNSRSKENVDVKINESKNTKEDQKNITEKINELREYREKVMSDYQVQTEERPNKRK